MQKKMIAIVVAAGILALVAVELCLAQPPQGGGPGGQGGFGGPGGNFDPAQMRQRMMENWKQQLGADDEAWKVIEPRFAKVMELNRQTMAGGMFGMRGMRGMRGNRGGEQGDRGNRGGPQGDRPRFPGQENREPTVVEKAQEALSTTLENESASADTIKEQLTALRAARVKAQQELAVAQQSLREILTVRQEAVLVLNGMLN